VASVVEEEVMAEVEDHLREAMVGEEGPYHQRCQFLLGSDYLGAVVAVAVAVGAADSRLARNLGLRHLGRYPLLLNSLLLLRISPFPYWLYCLCLYP
jgi:hypothetical protein